MKTPFLHRLDGALNATQNIPDTIGKSTYAMRNTAEKLNKTLTVIAVLLVFLTVTIAMGQVR